MMIVAVNKLLILLFSIRLLILIFMTTKRLYLCIVVLIKVKCACLLEYMAFKIETY